MNVLRIDDHVREVVLADHFAGQLLAIVPAAVLTKGWSRMKVSALA
jgi:hypothetical protein